jgi:hypothetical protein
MHPSQHLLSPITDEHICPMPWQERWELRTKTLGCNCSTTTFLAALGTCVGTLLALILLWVLWKIVKLIWVMSRKGTVGTELRVEEDGREVEGVWKRKRTWRGWWKSLGFKKGGAIRLDEDEDLLS